MDLSNDYPTFGEIQSRNVPTEFGLRLCALWNLNPANVTSFEITVNTDDMYARVELANVEGVLYELLTLTATHRKFIERMP